MTEICLNMIVKNEARVIRRCLDSVMPFISHWVIVDTGSSDGTQAIIAEHLRAIPGELFERPWKDFGHNRSEAIKLAAGKGDYLLFIDADDFLTVPTGFAMPKLTDEAYYVSIDDNGLVYRRKAIVSQRLPWKYVGVLHEYVDTDAKNYNTSYLEGPRILRNFGGSGLTEEESVAKYVKHAEIFEEALKAEPANSRYVFYLAQSYRDSRQFQKSLEAYQRRAAMGGWEEEVFCAKFQAARMSEKLGLDLDLIARRYLEAYEFRPARAEPLVELARIFRDRKRFVLAELYAGRAAQIPLSTDILFVDRPSYTWRALDELSIAKYWTGDYQNSAEMCRKLLASPELPEIQRPRITANLEFAEKKLGHRPGKPAVVTPAIQPLALPPREEDSLEAIIDHAGTIQIADIGAAFITEKPPYLPLTERGIGWLNAFDADQRQHQKIRDAFKGKVDLFSDIVGDGKKATLQLAGEESGMSSLLPPDSANLAFFNGFNAFGTIHKTEKVHTARLDDIARLPEIDFLKMDVQGSELSVLKNGMAKLKNCVAIQLEISFVPLYRGQPCFGEIDVWMRQQEFVPHMMVDLKRWSVSPLVRNGNFRVPFNQLLEGDIVYFRDPISTKALSVRQLGNLALVAHYCYASPDIVVHLLRKLVDRNVLGQGSIERYLKLIAVPPNPPFSLYE